MSNRPSVVWFRCDFRLADNPALTAAVARGGPVIPLFIWSPDEDGASPPGAASRWWLHQSLVALDRELRQHNSRLIIDRGPALVALRQVVQATKAAGVYWNRRYEPALVQSDRQVEKALSRDGTQFETFPGNLLFEPADILTKERKPYRVFTPFWKACRARGEPSAPLPVPGRWHSPSRWPKSLSIDARRARAQDRLGRRSSRRLDAGRARRDPPTGAVSRRGARRIHTRPRSTGHRRDVTAFAAPAFRRNHAAASLACDKRRQRQAEGGVFGYRAGKVPG